MGKIIILIGTILFIVGLLSKLKQSKKDTTEAELEAEEQKRKAIEEENARIKAENAAADAERAKDTFEERANNFQDYIKELISKSDVLKANIKTLKDKYANDADRSEFEEKYKKLLDKFKSTSEDARVAKEKLQKKINDLQRKLRENFNTSKTVHEPKTWQECAETLGLDGNDFTYDDVKVAYKKRAKEVTPNRVHGMDEEIVGLANSKATYVNLAHDYFKKYFNVK